MILKRKQGESPANFAERAAQAARKARGCVDFGAGPMCPTCAPSTGYAEEGVAEVLPDTDACYNCRQNPGPETPDLKRAVAGYEVFHKFTPREIGTLRGLKIPNHVVVAGEALQTLYRSDKWENKNHDYFHDHEGGVKLGRTDLKPETGMRRVPLPDYITGISAVYLLGKCLGFSYRDPAGEVIEAQVSPPLPELYAVPNRKALLVIDTTGNVSTVKAVLWGGKLEVKDVGIVG